MLPHPTVLIGLSPRGATEPDLRVQLVEWVRALGFDTRVTEDAVETRARIHAQPFAATLLDSAMLAEGRAAEVGAPQTFWRSVHPVLGRRLVLMVREVGKALWFEALSEGVGAVLPLPPREPMVQAALRAATGGSSPWGRRRRSPA